MPLRGALSQYDGRWMSLPELRRTYMRRTTCACINLCTPSQRLRALCRLAVHDMAIQQPWLDCLVPWVGKSVLDGFCPPLTIARPPDRVQVALNTKLRLIVTREANNSAFLTLSQLQAGSSLATFSTLLYHFWLTVRRRSSKLVQ